MVVVAVGVAGPPVGAVGQGEVAGVVIALGDGGERRHPVGLVMGVGDGRRESGIAN